MRVHRAEKGVEKFTLNTQLTVKNYFLIFFDMLVGFDFPNVNKTEIR